MARVYTQRDRLKVLIAFMETRSDACDEALEYCRSLGDISMGTFMTHIKNTGEFEPSWTAWCVLAFPKLMNGYLNQKFKEEMLRSPEATEIVNSKTQRKKRAMELIDNA